MFRGFEQSITDITNSPLTQRINLHFNVFVTHAKAVPGVGDYSNVSFFIERPRLDQLRGSIASPNSSSLVFACGPEGLVNSAWDICRAKTQEGNRVDFHHETFEF